MSHSYVLCVMIPGISLLLQAFIQGSCRSSNPWLHWEVQPEIPRRIPGRWETKAIAPRDASQAQEGEEGELMVWDAAGSDSRAVCPLICKKLG